MKKFERVIRILDDAVGGSVIPVGAHGAFWRDRTLDDFLNLKVQGLKLIVVGDGYGSNLVKSLKGENPFGLDIETQNASFNRMPSGTDPVSVEDIEFIKTWIDNGCQDGEIE